MDRIPRMETKRPPLRARAAWLVAFGALLAFHVAGNLWWLRTDNHEIVTDEAVHMETARFYHQALTSPAYKNPAERVIALTRIESRYPPLLHIAGALLCCVFGYSPDTMAATGTVLFLAIVVGMYATARLCFGRWTALFCAFVTSFLPIVYAGSRWFMTDYLSAAIVVWAIYCLLRSDGFRAPGWAFAFGLLNGLGVLARPTTPVFYVVPCLAVVVWGFALAWRGADRRRDLAALTVNGLISLTVTVGVFAPWYTTHFEYMYNYWFKQYRYGQGFTAPPLAPDVRPDQPFSVYQQTGQALPSAMPEVKRAEAFPLLQLLGAAVVPQPSAPAKASTHWLLKRQWQQLPIDVLNGCVFLPTYLLGLAGLAIAVFNRRYRKAPIVMMGIWLIGAYLVWTAVVWTKGPRYFIPAVPPFALLATIALDAIPRARLRYSAMALYAVVLVFTYGNLTYAAYGTAARLEIPVLRDSYDVRRFGDTGLVVYKDVITSGNFIFNAPQRRANATERILDTLRDDMKNRPATGEPYATYQVLGQNLRSGVFFHGAYFNAEHWFPLPNPYARSARAEDLLPKPIRRIGPAWPDDPQALRPELPNTDYVVMRYAPALGESGQEEQWERVFLEAGFTRVARFDEGPRGWTPESQYTVLAAPAARFVPGARWAPAGAGASSLVAWTLPEGAALEDRGVLLRAAQSGQGLSLEGFAHRAASRDALRVSIAEEGGAGLLENVTLQWARPDDGQAPGVARFSAQRSLPLVEVQAGLWEARPGRHRDWSGRIDGLQVIFTMPSRSVRSHLAQRIEGLTSGPASHWNFASLAPAQWQWNFDGRVRQTEYGALHQTKKDGWGPRLSNARLAAESTNTVFIEIAATAPGGGDVPIEKAHVYWAREQDPQARWPFSHARAVRLEPLEAGQSRIWIGDLSAHELWSGTVRDIFIGMDFDKTQHLGLFQRYNVYIKQIGFLSIDKAAVAVDPGGVRLRAIEIGRLEP